MALTCGVTKPAVIITDVTLDLQNKITKLTETVLGVDSLYMRAKDTFKELFDNKGLTEKDYATAASAFISNLTTSTIQTVVGTALEWEKSEIELSYSTALTKSQIYASNVQIEKVKTEICVLEKENVFKCAQTTATIAGSIRDNGRVATWDTTDPCKPLTLQPEGTKYQQELFIESQKYANLADAFRKSGIVTIGTTLDGVRKGISGDTVGYTNAQEEFARRQIISFEDSKRNHAANAMSQSIGQLLSTDKFPHTDLLNRYYTAIDYLNTDNG